MKQLSGFRKTGLWFAGTICIIFILSRIFSGSFQFRMNDKEVDKYFRDIDVTPDFVNYTLEGRNIFYAATGNDTSRMIVFIHGTPGAWTNFINFLGDKSLISRYRLISIERPGFGHSDFGKDEPLLEDQARLMKPVLEMNKSKKLPILVGHSIGGPIAAKMLMMYPDLIGGAVLVAPSIDPDLEPREPWRKFLRLPVIENIIPVAVRVSNEEIFYLKKQLVELLPQWQSIEKPVIVIQGGDDFLVDPKTADFAEKMLIHSPHEIMFVEDADHFIPWTDPELIHQALTRISP